MRYVINYSSGGLGNRLIPLCCCMQLAEKTNRSVGLVWNSTERCMGDFKNLFINSDIEIIDINSLNPNDVVIYTEPWYITHDFELNKNPDLFVLSQKCEVKTLDKMNEIYSELKKYVIIYENTIFLELNDIPSKLKSLTPTTYISDKVTILSEELGLNKNVLGIHARGTDFIGETLDKYEIAINNIINNNPNQKVLFCSDSLEWETNILNKYPNNIIIRPKKDYITKINEGTGWINNAHTSEDSVIEGLIDIYLLSKTNFIMYNPNSTFAKIVNFLK